MATWQTDILGTGLAHHAPTVQERKLARRIASRWREWHPLLLHELRQRPHPPGHVSREILRFERVHAQALASMLTVGVPWVTIKRVRLDDPRWTDDERARKVAHPYAAPKPTTAEKRAASVERKRKRMAVYEKVGRNVVRRSARREEAGDA